MPVTPMAPITSVLGQAGAHKIMLMAAIAFNLKKHLKKGGRKPYQAFFEAILDTLQRHLLLRVEVS